MAFALAVVVEAQDTVRYGDPWYAFNPLPPLVRPNHNNEQLACGNPFYINLHCWAQNQIIERRYYQMYLNDNYEIYGIAYTADTFPGEQLQANLRLRRGLEFHSEPWYISWAPEPYWDYNLVYIDNWGEEDSLLTWLAPRRKCVFEYFMDYDTSSHFFIEKDSVISATCFEFYFDHPIALGGEIDSFYIGAGACAYPTGFPFETYPELGFIVPSNSFYYGVDTSACQTWIDIDGLYAPDGYQPNVTNRYAYFANYYQHCPTTQYTMNFQLAKLWGAIFPIVKLRCVTPKLYCGGWRDDSSVVVYWRQYDLDAPEGYELAVGLQGSDPDTAMPLQVNGTYHIISDLVPDSTYSVWIRKSCRYTTVEYDTVVWSDWSQPVTIDRHGNSSGTAIGEESDGMLRVYCQDGRIVVESEVPLPEVRVYDMLGRKVAMASATGAQLVMLTPPSKGVYVVKIYGQSARRVVIIQ